jgi:hypothetical protein
MQEKQRHKSKILKRPNNEFLTYVEDLYLEEKIEEAVFILIFKHK